MTNQEQTDEAIGITRCVHCGHRLEHEIECPFCSIVQGTGRRVHALPKWVYITACFLASPLSGYFILKDKQLSALEKVFTLSGCLLWFSLYNL